MADQTEPNMLRSPVKIVVRSDESDYIATSEDEKANFCMELGRLSRRAAGADQLLLDAWINVFAEHCARLHHRYLIESAQPGEPIAEVRILLPPTTAADDVLPAKLN